jgi:hypothetical protein
LKPKTIHITSNEPIQKWADDNHTTIMDSLYDTIFDFVESGEEKRVVLKLVSKPKYHSKITGYDVINVEFTIAKDEISETIDKLIHHLEEVEEYEKCAELVKLKYGIK